MTSLGIDIGGTSVKLAAVRDGQVLWTGQSSTYEFPSTQRLIDAIREADAGRCAHLGKVPVGLCVPGLLDKPTRTITLAVNVPGLVGIVLDDLIARALQQPPGSGVEHVKICNDALAAAVDFHAVHQTTGRLFALAIGTGVGAAVLDDGKPLLIESDSPGHIGMLDVSLDDNPPIGSDGGAGSLESYIGASAIRARLSDGMALADLPHDDAILRALARGLRIAHAIYRPNHFALLGGTGTRMKPLLPAIRALVEKNLTSVAQPTWTLHCGDNDFHSAVGAARLACQ